MLMYTCPLYWPTRSDDFGDMGCYRGVLEMSNCKYYSAKWLLLLWAVAATRLLYIGVYVFVWGGQFCWVACVCSVLCNFSLVSFSKSMLQGFQRSKYRWTGAKCKQDTVQTFQVFIPQINCGPERPTPSYPLKNHLYGTNLPASQFPTPAPPYMHMVKKLSVNKRSPQHNTTNYQDDCIMLHCTCWNQRGAGTYTRSRAVLAGGPSAEGLVNGHDGRDRTRSVTYSGTCVFSKRKCAGSCYNRASAACVNPAVTAVEQQKKIRGLLS